jgi:hypothetical protein
MRAQLERLDTRGIVLDLPTARDGKPQSVALRTAEGLKGTLEHDGQQLSLTGVAAEHVLFEAIGLVFGNVRLTEGELDTRGLYAELTQRGDSLALEFGTESISAGSSAVDVGPFHVEGRVRLERLDVKAHAHAGHVAIGKIEVNGFRLRDGSVSMIADLVTAHDLYIAWGGPNGLELRASLFEAPELRFFARGLELTASAYSAKALGWRGGHATVGSASVGHTRLTGHLEKPAESDEVAPPSVPAFDLDDLRSERAERYLRVLDGLSGHFDVDVAVDVRLPLLGSSRRVHELRVPLEGGSFDYRQLERNLPTLENALLDFAVRDGALGLELGIPLLPTRGRGKQLIVWDLGPSDLALAEQSRLRLAVLPLVRPAIDIPSPSAAGDDKPAFSLEHVGLSNIDIALGLAHEAREPEAPLRQLRFEALTLRGDVHHTVEGNAQSGELVGALRGLEAQIHQLPLAESRLTVDSFSIQEVGDIHLLFLETHPTRIDAEVKQLTLSGLTFVHPSPRRATNT